MISSFGDFIPLFIYRVWTNSRITDTRCNRTHCTLLSNVRRSLNKNVNTHLKLTVQTPVTAVTGTSDFFGLNHYTTRTSQHDVSADLDCYVGTSADRTWSLAASRWLNVSFEHLLKYSWKLPVINKFSRLYATKTNCNAIYMFHQNTSFPFYSSVANTSMLSGSTVTTAWRVLGLRIQETASRYGG
jgi:hypothetical protein